MSVLDRLAIGCAVLLPPGVVVLGTGVGAQNGVPIFLAPPPALESPTEKLAPASGTMPSKVKPPPPPSPRRFRELNPGTIDLQRYSC